MAKMGIGLQLYTLRDETKKDFRGTLRRVAELGYEGVEFAGFGDFEPQELAEFLGELGLKSLGSHIGIDELRNNLDNVIDFQLTIGSRYVVCPWLAKELRDTPEQVRITAALFNEIGQKLADHGLVFGYHNHEFEFTNRVGDVLLFDALFAQANPAFVKAELDVCWAQHGGQDPLVYIEKYTDRLPLIHLKDLRVENGKPLTVPLGEGQMQLQSIVEASSNAGVDWLVVEQDEVQYDAFESVANSLRWLQKNYLKV
ncbi:sugar phosphate isomerase/epimerase [Alicyclobacillus curvatus]|jgi:sugar phosphate isomerase/epimerase|nr:sugar phosphate isomerase/epimerase [Alicyclobacillus curvatus]